LRTRSLVGLRETPRARRWNRRKTSEPLVADTCEQASTFLHIVRHTALLPAI